MNVFLFEGRIGCTGTGILEWVEYHYGTHQRMTWSLEVVSLAKIQYADIVEGGTIFIGEVGGRIDLIRHFRYCSIGFYAMKAQGALKNGGFRFKWLFLLINTNVRMCGVLPSDNWGMSYNAGNERYYYKNYYALPNDNIMQQNQFNPYFIKSELLNFK